MTAPRFYSWDDDGSPGRALTGNLQNRLKQILVPCLVTGYGSKPGAGWTLEHEHANGFTLSNGDAYVNFVSNLPANAPYLAMNAQAIHIYCAESLTDTSQAIIDGANLCSGTYRNGNPELPDYPRHMLGRAQYPLQNNLAGLQWTLVADKNTFTLNCSGEYSNTTSSDSLSYSFTLHAGEALLSSGVSGGFLVLGGDIAPFSQSPLMYTLSRGYTSPRDLSTGTAQSAPVFAEPYASTFGINASSNIASMPELINFQQPRLMSPQKFLGRLRGVVYDDVLRSNYGWEVALKALGFSGADFTDRGKPVKIGDYSYAFARSASGNSFLTDNPAFW